ncbi:hypothetical protein A5698_02580 [Mycobacterium sp. E136]|uniref:hypothetical protein n=1 Tax=Mycobacterium sp. E136 TaxID=1834125 RepID=UPI0007FC6FA3|nr:hypothetical protein [Mycobacterium sp. E136]OBG88950.1 hypothetical protein A5698_02580 [Mycobacterium sp. E136]
MLTIRDHQIDDYADLKDMDASDVGVLSDEDRECLAELADYLVTSGGSERFAVWLLHKHFLPADGEVFVERAIVRPPQTHTTPIARSAFSSDGLQATSIRFDTKVTSGVGLIGMEFAGPADFGPAAPIRAEDEAVLAGLAERLIARDKIDRFGVRLIRNQLGIADKKDLMETCDKPHRSLHCTVIDKADVPVDSAIETTWLAKATTVEDGATASTFCSGVHCYHYCWGC